AGRDVGNLGEIDREQEDVGDVDLPGPPQDAGAGEDEAAFAHFLAVDEGGGVAGDEDENLGRVAEAVVADGGPGHEVRRNIVDEDQPERDPQTPDEPQIA